MIRTKNELIDVELLLQTLEQECPPIVTRRKASELLGNSVAVRTWANLKSMGSGPKSLRFGKSEIFSREALLEWVREKMLEG